MMSVNQVLNYYSSEDGFIYSSMERAEWEDRNKAIAYLERFRLAQSEYDLTFKSIHEKLFDLEAGYFPGLIFREGLKLASVLGGLTLVEPDYLKLTAFMRAAGDRSFCIIQNKPDHNVQEKDLLLRFNYPVDASWRDLMSGAFISSVVFEKPHDDYFVFGDSGKWGKYVANDLETPLDIWGLNSEVVELFSETFLIEYLDDHEVWESIPKAFAEKYSWIKD